MHNTSTMPISIIYWNQMAMLGMYTLLRCPLKILDAFPFCSMPNDWKLCACVRVFTQVDWTFNTHHSNIASQSFYFIVFTAFHFDAFFFFLSFSLSLHLSLPPPMFKRQFVGCLVVCMVYFIYFCIQYEIANLFPCFNLGVICCLAWRHAYIIQHVYPIHRAQ